MINQWENIQNLTCELKFEQVCKKNGIEILNDEKLKPVFLKYMYINIILILFLLF